MNLLKAQDYLKGVPDAVLEKYKNNPVPDIPPILVGAEAARRDKMRKEYEAERQGKAPTSTVMDDLMNSLGVASLQPPGQQQVPVQTPQMPAAPQEPVQMYDGGIVAFADGGMPSMEDVESYLAPRAGGSEMGFAASVAPYIPALDARVRAGVLGNTMQGNPQVSGYQIGYEDGVNSVMANIIPTPAGKIVGGEYRRQLGNDAELALRGNVNPYGEMPAMDFRQAPVSVEYTKRFDKGGIASFQDGGNVYQNMPEYASNIQIPDLPGFNDFLNQVKGYMGDSTLPRYQEEISEERKRLEQNAPTGISSLLKNIGQGMVLSKNRNFIGAAAEGIASGISLQEQAEIKHREAMRQLRASEIELAQKQRAEKAGNLNAAAELEQSAAAKRNAAITQSQGAAQLALLAKKGEDERIEAQLRAKNDERRLAIEAQRLRAEIANRGAINPKDIFNLRIDINQSLSNARKNLDSLYKDASADPNHWYSMEKQRIASLPSANAQRVETERLRARLEDAYGITGLQSMLSQFTTNKKTP